MRNKITRLLFGLLKTIAINALRATIIILAYIFRLVVLIAEFGLLGLASVANYVDIRITYKDKQKDQQFDQKYTENEIEQLALKLPEKISTIQEIAEYLGVSYRQARKVKNCQPLRINSHIFA